MDTYHFHGLIVTIPWLLCRQCMVAWEIIVEIFLIKLLNKKAFTKHRKRLKDIHGCHGNLFLHINLSNNQKLLKKYQKLGEIHM